MNFTTPSDFLYVTGENIDTEHPHGDLDRIMIGNHIMPMRSQDEKNILYGMDPAFLCEAACEREGISLRETVVPHLTFDRSLKLSGLYEPVAKLQSAYVNSLSYTKKLEEKTWVFKNTYDWHSVFPYRPGRGIRRYIDVDPEFESPEMKPDSALDGKYVLDLLTLCNSMRKFQVPNRSSLGTLGYYFKKSTVVPSPIHELLKGEVCYHELNAVEDGEWKVTSDYTIYGSGQLYEERLYPNANPYFKKAFFEAWCLLHLQEEHYVLSATGALATELNHVIRLCRCLGWEVGNGVDYIRLHTANNLTSQFEGMMKAGDIVDMGVPSGWKFDHFHQYYTIEVVDYWPIFTIPNRTIY